jgi:hypothetical protein
MDKCEKYLFRNFRTLSSPALHLWTTVDSAFIQNPDTIYVMIKQNGKLVLEGQKLPGAEAYGEVKIYNSNSELIKIEIWNEVPYLQIGNAFASWSDGAHWMKQLNYKRGELIRETNRSIAHDVKKGFACRTEITYYQNGKKKRTRIKNKYF